MRTMSGAGLNSVHLGAANGDFSYRFE